MRTVILASVLVLAFGLAAPAQVCFPQNLALYRVAKASSTYGLPNCSPALAFDGNARTAWNAGRSRTSWIEVDLGKVEPVGQVWLDIGQSPAHTITRVLEVSADGLKYTTVLVDQRRTHQYEKLILVLPATAMSRYVRVTNNSTLSWNAYFEIGVYGPSTASAPVATIGASDGGDCQSQRSHLMVRVSGQPGHLCLLGCVWWNIVCAPIKAPPLQGNFYFGGSPWVLLGGRTLDASGQATLRYPVGAIPTGFSYFFQAAVFEAQNPANGGFTNLHAVKY